MPDEDIKLGTIADEPTTTAAPDMNRYYYRPGVTEPELRPEFANEAEEPKKAAKPAKPKKVAKKARKVAVKK